MTNYIFTQLPVNVAVNKINIWRVRYRFSLGSVTIDMSRYGIVTTSTIDCDLTSRTETKLARHEVDVLWSSFYRHVCVYGVM